MRLSTWIGSGMVMGLLLGSSAILSGCGGEAATGAPATTPTAASPEDEASAADLHEHHRHHHHGGVVMFIAMSLDSLGVTPEQAQQIEKIQGDLFAKMEPSHVAEQHLMTVLADGIAAGKVDETKVNEAINGVATASAGLHDATIAALNELHGVLKPEQRATLVDKVQAHFEVWKKANSEELKPGDAAHPAHLEVLAKELNLAPDQVEKIRATFADRVKSTPNTHRFNPLQAEAHLQEFGNAFKSETFDAKNLPRRAFVNQNLALWGSRRMAHFVESIDPILTPDQRTKFSAELKEHAAAKSGIFDGDKHER